jgi:hypothetical protein
MTKVLDLTEILAMGAKGRFQNPAIGAGYGLSIFGVSLYGDESGAGGSEPIIQDGMYQMRTCKEGKIPIRMKLYDYVITNTEAQQIQRQKYADGVLAWQGLTNPQKLLYNERAKSLPYSGYNLFLKEYLNSH